MRTLSFVSKFLMWALLMVYSVFQVLAVFGIMGSNADIIKAGQGGRTVSPIPLIAATILMLAAVILFAALAKRKYIGLIVSVVASAVMLMVALELGRQFPPSVSATVTVGLTTWKLIWRHIGIAAVSLFMLVAWLADRQLEKAYSRSREGKSGYDLSGQPLFKSLDDPGEAQQEKPKPKRSIRERIRKQRENQ